MTCDGPEYDPRYLAGIVLFNRGDFFEAHEVWESLWMETAGPERRFVQGLIQVAVGLCHFGNGNLRGAAKLYRSSRDYMNRFPPRHLGLDQVAFWKRLDECFAGVAAVETGGPKAELREELIPEITLDPAPEAWPDPAEFLGEEDALEGTP